MSCYFPALPLAADAFPFRTKSLCWLPHPRQFLLFELLRTTEPCPLPLVRKNAFTLVTELNDFQFHVVQRQGLFQPSLELWCQVFHTVSALSSLAIWTSLKKRSHLVFLLKNVVVALWNGLIILIRCGKSFGVHVYRLNLKGAGHTCLARFIPQQTTLRERREEWQIQLNTSLGLLPSEDISSFILELDSLMSR